MAVIDKKYHDLLLDILHNGYKYEDPNRKGINRIQIPHATIVHNFKDGFPAITTKKLHWKGVVGELLWILRGSDNIKYLVDNGINIWNKDAYNYYLSKGYLDCDNLEEYIDNVKNAESWVGDIGRGYGAQLRKWLGSSFYFSMGDLPHRMNYIDQFAELINTLKTNPMATKKTVTFWNPSEKDQCALTPCHWSFEILVEPLTWGERNKYVQPYHGSNIDSYKNVGHDFFDKIKAPKYQFTLKWHQHSVDTFLGLPFNIASYALLAHIIGKMTNMIPKGIIGDLSNVHIYEPHLPQVKEQLRNDSDRYNECKLEISKLASKRLTNTRSLDEMLNSLEINDFTLKNYESYPSIKAEMLPYNN